MLVLMRKAGEKIVVADGITIAVSEIGQNRVRLTIKAPPNVRIVRSEVSRSDRRESLDSEASECNPGVQSAM